LVPSSWQKWHSVSLALSVLSRNNYRYSQSSEIVSACFV
jgi:hypothetical protein